MKGQPYNGIRLPYDEADRLWAVFNRQYLVVFDIGRAPAIQPILADDIDENAMWTRALAHSQAALQVNPNDPFAWFNLGDAFVSLGQFREATQAFDRARRIGLPWRMLWYQFGPFRAYYETGRYDEVIALADHTISTARQTEEAYYWKGMAQNAKGDTAQRAPPGRKRSNSTRAMLRQGPHKGQQDGDMPTPLTDPTATRQRLIARNVLLVSAAFGLAAAAGLVRNMIIARQFGIGADLDAYYAAFKLPDLLFTVVAGGALATAFIPVFAGFVAAGDREGAWRLASAITNWVALVAGALALVVAVAAPWLVQTVIAPGFDAAQTAETVSVMRIVLVSTLVFCISALQGSILHGYKHFLLPALAPVVYPLGIIAGAVWLVPLWGVRGLAAGAVIGAGLHLAIKIPALIRYGFRWQPILKTGDGAVRQVLVLLGPRVLDLGVFHLTLLATTNLASRLGPGGVSALEWGWDAMQLPETIIGTAFGLVTFPTLAELATRGDRDGLRSTLSDSLRTVLTLAVPAAVGLILLGRPLLALLYQRGAFDAQATEAVYVALRFYALGLTGHVCLELATRAFFAQRDTLTPLLFAVASAAANIGLASLLMGPLGYGGLALANSLAVTAEVVALLFVLRRRLGGTASHGLSALLLRALTAAAAMGGAILLLATLADRAGWGNGLRLTVSGIAGMVVYLAACEMLRVRELGRFVGALLGRSS